MLARAVLAAILLCLPSQAADWPQFRGSDQDGRVDDPALRDVEGLAFETRWTRQVGSGYSGLVIAEGRVYTMGSQPQGDYVLAFDAESGEEVWRARISPVYRGHDGSDDGPISTPAFSQGRLYALSAHGHLAAFDAADGSVLWRRHLVEDFQGVAPYYGYSTSPLVEGDLLVIQTGAPQGILAALDKNSGELRWTALPGQAEYQTPLLTELAGRRQLIASSAKEVAGLDPSSGEILWKHTFEEASIDPHIVPAKEAGFLVTRSSQAVFFKLRRQGEAWQAEEQWRTRSFKNTHSVPVYFQGHFYGYNGRFLTCVNVDTGQDAWKSRPPGGHNLTLVGNTFLVLASGELAAFKADPAQYREIGSRQIFNRRDTWTAPAFAGGRIYLRDLDEIAAVDPRPHVETVVRVDRPEPDLMRGPFGQFIRRLEQAPDSRKEALIEEFMEGQEGFPLVEDRVVHFVFRGPAEDVAIRGDMTGGVQDAPFFRVEGTDFYFRSFRAESDAAAWQYHLRHFEEVLTDPLNPKVIETPDGPRSFASLPQWKEPELPAAPGPQRLRRHEIESRHMGRNIALQVLLPPSFQVDETYPLALFLSDHARNFGHFDRWLEKRTAEGAAPVVAAFLEINRPFFQVWFLRQRGDGAIRMLGEEVFPFLKDRYPLAEGDGHMVIGHGEAGPGALLAALLFPQHFGRAAMQSAVLSDDEIRQELIPRLEEDSDQRIFISYSLHDRSWRPLMDFDVAGSSRFLAAELRTRGYEVEVRPSAGGHNWPTWRAQGGHLLEFLHSP
ncbi:MAG TPA: PQQ-binding-like beta-propeller repeat protein [Acidobacteriota bacterium]|nr:PQQ-binding-like beta-propeller repeat protein [Acidobacteriota bacterium]